MVGTITDVSGAPIPGARITAISHSTGLSREVVTNTEGIYQIIALDPGNYSIKVESNGVSAQLERIAVSVGSAIRVNVTVSIQKSVESVDVTASASATEPTASELLDENVIQHLPINGRRFQDFATLAPGVQASTQTRDQLSFSGQRGIYSNVMVDGSDYNEPFQGGIRGGDRSSLAFTIPQSAVQEFQADESGYASEYGRSTGGALNVVTRYGANKYSGEAFYQIRPHALSAGDPYGLSSIGNQHQFGGSLGGPVVRDKLFFFVASEWQLASFPQNVRFPAVDAFAGNVTPDIAPAYNYLHSLEGSFNQTNNIGANFGRLDYQFRDGSRVAARYNHSQNHARNAILAGFTPQTEVNQALSANGNDEDYTDTATVQFTSVLPKAVNDLRLEYSRERYLQTSNAASPWVSAGPIGSFGNNPVAPNSLSDYRAQISESISMVRGRHSFSLGADYSYIAASSLGGPNQYGSFVIDSTDPQRILQILSGTSMNRFDDPSVTYLLQVGDLRLGAHANQAAVFGQDNWRITSTVSLNYGLRWEGQMNPQPRVDNSFLLANVLNYPFPLGQVDPTAIRSQLNQWAPRTGLAWDPTGRGTTIIRASAGLFYGQTPLTLYAGPINSFSSVPSDLTLQIAPSAAGTVYRQFLAGGFNLNAGTLSSLPVFTVPDVWVNVAGKPNPFAQAGVVTTSAQNFRNPRGTQLSLVAQHQFSNRVVVDYQVVHIDTSHLERNIDYNVPSPSVMPGDLSLRPFFGLESGTPRANPNLGAVLVRDSGARSNYLANTLRVRYRVKNIQLTAHYTLSYNKSDDDNERQLDQIGYQNPFNFTRDYNWSDLDSRHEIAGYALWQAPFGLEVSSIFHYRSALPIDAITGVDNSELLTPNLGNRPLDAPGVYMLRNSFRNRDFKTIDLRIAKTVRATERVTLQLYGEFFNLFNFSNVAFVPSSVYPNNPAFIYGLGILSNGSQAPVSPGFLSLRTASGGYAPVTTYQQGTPFEAQLGLRIAF